MLISAGALTSREGSASRQVEPDPAPITATEALADTAAIAGVAVPAPAAPEAPWTTLTIKRGEAFSTLIEGAGMPKSDWVAVTSLGDYGKRLRRLRAGETIRLRKQDGRLQELLYELGETQTLHLRRKDGGSTFEGFIIAKELERRPTFARGTIDGPLFLAGRDAGLSDGLILELADVFGYDIDFNRDIRQGDRFTVIYEEVFKDGKKLRDGAILAADFVNQGQTFRAVRYTDPAGNVSFYTPSGQSLRKAFLKSPLDFTRVTSSFNLARRHPVLNKIRAHKGTDYGASTGTPIKATGDGRVAFMGVKGGYGKVVILNHGGGKETLYAHMSRFRTGLGVGTRVKQGQVIGYVGKTGLATAAHLHYEFRIKGIHKNPERLQLPRSEAIAQHLLPQFQQATSPLLTQLETLSRARYASAE